MMAMEVFDAFRDRRTVENLAGEIRKISKKSIVLMEVCGGHTMAIQKYGLPALLPETVTLKSGPGCPVCVTSQSYINRAIAYCRLDDVILTTYGDLIRVPGSSSSLEKERAQGRDVRIVYSSLDALQIAKEYPDKKVVFLGVGFETTAPTTAATIIRADADKISNFFVYSAHKVMPPVMGKLVDEGVKINGYIAPGHVSTITGSGIYKDIAGKYGLCCVVSGFEPVDILNSVLMLVKQFEAGEPKVEIEYTRAVLPEGNEKAQQLLYEVFEHRDDWWRGLDVIPKSGLGIRDKYASFDTEKQIEVEVEETKENPECICGEILKGLKNPRQCKLFARGCDPSNPVGACMVSHEGACHAYYRYSSHG